LVPPPQDFTDPGWRATTSPRRVFFAIREGRIGTAMPSWKSLSEQDDWDLTAYVQSLAGQK
jgi:mono/diheme cytochrome c family protein